MKKKLLLGLAIGLFALGITGNSFASVVDQSNTSFIDNYAVLDQAVTWEQDIFAGMSGALTGVDIFLTDFDNISNPEDVTAEIWKGGFLLGSDIVNWTDSGSRVRTLFDFSSDNIQLSAGELFTMKITGGDSIFNFGIDLTLDDYPGLFGPDAEWFDMAFETYMDTSAIPEPASMFLFGFGLLGLAGVSRRIK